MRRRRVFGLLGMALVGVISCKGADGATGPAGPQGEQGPQGTPAPEGATVYTVTGSIASDGTARVDLPAMIGASGDLPALSCYISDDRVTWLAVAEDVSAGLACGINEHGTELQVVIVGAVGFGYFYFAITYLPST